MKYISWRFVAFAAIAIGFALVVVAFVRPVLADGAATAGNPAAAVNGAKSPDAWFNDAKQSNWDVTTKISPGMSQILGQALIDFSSYTPRAGCESAAANQAWQALADAANAGPLEGFIDAIKSALTGIKNVATFGADPSAAADAVEAGKLAEKAFEEAKDKGSDWLKERLKQIWKGKPVEVLERVSDRGGCHIILVAIWDKAAQKYEITIYGDCQCALIRDWNGSRSIQLKTFAVQLTGSVIPDIVDGERVLHVGFPKITDIALCDCNPGGATRPLPQASPSAPSSVATPSSGDQWRKLTTTCKACQPIVDEIHAAQAARDGMDTQFRQAQNELEAADGDKAAAAEAKAKFDALTQREAGLILLQQRLYAKLKACEQECVQGTVAPAQPGVPAKPMDKDSNLQPAQPVPGQNKSTGGGVSLPPWAGAGSTIVINVNPNDEPEGGADGVVLVTEDQSGHKQLFQGKGNNGRIAIVAGLAAATLKAIEVVTGFDEHGNPITGSRCDIGNPPHIEGTQPLVEVPPGKLAISEAGSSVQPGDTMTLHLQGNDPLTTRFMLDGQPLRVLAVSDDSALVQFDNQTTLAHHQLTMLSRNDQTSPLTIAVVKLIPHPLPVSHPGVTETVTIDVAGLTPSDDATMYFELEGDAASIVSGGNSAAVPVTDGKAQLQIVGKHAGQIGLRYRLVVKNPQFTGE